MDDDQSTPAFTIVALSIVSCATIVFATLYYRQRKKMYGERPSTENLVDDQDDYYSPTTGVSPPTNTLHGRTIPSSQYDEVPMVPMRSPNEYDNAEDARRGGEAAMASEHIYQKMAIENSSSGTRYPNEDIVEVEALDSDVESTIPLAYGETTLANNSPVANRRQYDMVTVPLT
jgi:hypothetical protein